MQLGTMHDAWIIGKDYMNSGVLVTAWCGQVAHSVDRLKLQRRGNSVFWAS